jgi:O-methyltransferase involved in polyketide biosynthesis
MERIPIDLSGIPETLLGNLGRRAAAVRLGALEDPMAIEVVDQLEYDFADSSRGAQLHAVRVATFDAAVRRFLASHPAATVVALGEGLETQFWRIDNGQVRWLTVDLPETMDLRHRVLPDAPRQSSHRGSALDLTWVDRLDPTDPILITAQGLLPYFQRDQVHDRHWDATLHPWGSLPSRDSRGAGATRCLCCRCCRPDFARFPRAELASGRRRGYRLAKDG